MPEPTTEQAPISTPSSTTPPSTTPPSTTPPVATAPITMAPDDELAELLGRWLPGQRWFAGKGDAVEVTIESRRHIADLPERSSEQVLFTVPLATGTHRYQVWVGWTHNLPERLAGVLIGEAGGSSAFDALHDSGLTSLLLSNISKGATIGDIEFVPEPGVVVDEQALGKVISAEQSNTSIVFGHSSILKVFRRLEPGANPDAEIHRALHAAGASHIATALGTIEGPVAGERTTLALLTEFFANSVEGWAMATQSVRDLMAEGDLSADEVGGDFAAESLRLGRAVAQVHIELAKAFGTRQLDAAGIGELISGMIATAEKVAAYVPSVAAHLDAIRATFTASQEQTATMGGAEVQRIHGDLQLGQTLRTLTGWAIIDFEGEPSKSLAERTALHSPLRDVAGMLRSFDYAANHSGGASDSQHAYRAQEWATRNRKAFCDGYAAVAGFDPRERGPLLGAFELDKAVYEVAYEHGHRPTWESIPLQAVARLTKTGGKS